jgi:hypothetical protein
MKRVITILSLAALFGTNAFASGQPVAILSATARPVGELDWIMNAREAEPTVEDSAAADFSLSFGAGAVYLNPYRPSDNAKGQQVLPTFFFNWAPFWVSEIGAAMDIGQKNSFIFRPNAKVFFIKSAGFSVYLEGNAAIFSHPSGTDVGGGASLGMIIGLMDHVGLEIRAGGLAANMSPEAAAHFVEAGNMVQRSALKESSTVLFPSAGASLMARF